MTKKRGGSGGLSRRAALAMIGGGGLLGVSSTGAFDQVGADRAFNISVDNDKALLDVTLLQDSFEVLEDSEISPDLLKIENQSSESERASEDPGITFNSVKIKSPGYNRYVQFELNTEDLANGLTPDSSVTIPGTISGKRSTASSIPITLTVTANSDDDGIADNTEGTDDADGDEESVAPPVDPGEYTIDDLAAHLDAEAYSAAELQALLDAEVAGKDREGAMDVIEAALKE